MAKQDADGVTRVDIKWSIEGSKGTKRGQLYGLHAQEVMAAREAIKRQARRGDTIDIQEI